MSIQVRIPNVGESVNEVTLASWLVQDGAYVEMDQPICELETDKASQELFAEAAGIISLKVEEGVDLKIGDLLAEIDGSSAPAANSKPAQEANESVNTSSVEQSEGASQSHVTPVAAQILKEKGIDPNSVKGTGTGGKVVKKDALEAANPAPVSNSRPKTEAKTIAQPVSVVSSNREVYTKRMSRLRQTLATKLVEVKNQTAMLTTFNEVDMSAVMELRKKYKELFKERHEVGLGFMSFFTKAVCLAAKDVPAVNGKIEGDNIVTYNYCDVGIAVSTERGLVVPVIKDADKMTLAQIEKSVMGYALKARDNKLSIDEMQGGTFTITNGGVFGSMLSTPIINGNQSAILGMHNIVQRPVAVNGNVEVRPIMYVALSYDHRIIDGKESVTFLYRVKELLEDPSRLLLEI
ncbi:MAG: 2-oxoglutarate dehydrogenase complex dihydrolipoyllysine-residue succinyltransferase [Bacteroidetes bacterium]|nr:2-oxoglutarate dehydrogenase complex dihydrolipoyllysine-residue succinyltransferase [Bacteroidota bacterium]